VPGTNTAFGARAVESRDATQRKVYRSTEEASRRTMRGGPPPKGEWIMGKIATALMATAAVSIGLVGCGGDDTGSAEGTIDVTLSDFKMELGETSAPAGKVTFKVQNNGPSVHEFVVFNTDLAEDALPKNDDGDVAESDSFAPVDEIEDIEKGATPSLQVDLPAGSYVLICNVAGHYRQGMHASLTVT
jgi:uncharacterized cupredoxin-like copper-binding protein